MTHSNYTTADTHRPQPTDSRWRTGHPRSGRKTPDSLRPGSPHTWPFGLRASDFAPLHQALLLALSLLAAGCGRDNTFVLATATGPSTFNPLFALDGSSDAIVRLLNGALINMDQTSHEPRPGLAESWSVAPDQKTWTFKIRQGVRWSDGRPLTAADVVFTWNAIMYNPTYNQLTYGLFRIGGKPFAVTNLDELTVQVVTPEVFAPFLEFFGSVAILPKHVLEGPVK